MCLRTGRGGKDVGIGNRRGARCASPLATVAGTPPRYSATRQTQKWASPPAIAKPPSFLTAGFAPLPLLALAGRAAVVLRLPLRLPLLC